MNERISFTFNYEAFTGLSGQSIAAALLAAGVRELRVTRFNEKPRSIFCGIGICFDCVVVVNGIANQRACLIEIAEGMMIVSAQ